jgi:hypothetical protein
MIKIFTPSGQEYQIIYYDKNCTTYRHLPIKKPKHEIFSNSFDSFSDFKYKDQVLPKTIVTLLKNGVKINLDDIISETDLSVIFTTEYYIFDGENVNKIENMVETCDICELKELFKNNPFQLIFVDENNENYKLYAESALYANASAIQCVKKQENFEFWCSCEIMMYNIDSLKFIKNPSLEICKLVLSRNVLSLKHINNPTEEMCKYAVQRNGLALEYVKNQTEEICAIAINLDGSAFKFVDPELYTEKICNLAAKRKGENLKYIKNQTFSMCIEAVKNNGMALEYVDKSLINKKMCIEAVICSAWAFQFVPPELLTEEIYKIAVIKEKYVLTHIYQTEEICKAAVMEDGWALQYIQNQTDEICRLAIRQNKDAAVCIKSKSQKKKFLSNI